MPEATATFALKIDSDAEPAKESAAALESFRAAIVKSQAAIANYRRSQSLLKGSSDEVKDAKAKLTAAIAAEQAAITKNNLGILKLSGSYDKLQKAEKKKTDALAVGKKAIVATGGPLKDVSDRFETLKGVLSGVTSGWGLLAVATVVAVAGIAAAGVAIATLVGKLTEWTVTSADALRTMALTREAVSGSTRDATAWGHQIDWLSLKVATSKDRLNELAVATEKALRGTRVSGAGMVDIFKAVAVTGAAMGDDVGDALKTILERGKTTGRLGIDFVAPGISELQGTGITFEQVAQQLAKDLNIGLDEASAALVSHRVTMDAGAKAIREVVETRFGDVNAKKLLSLGGIFTKLSDNVRDWTQDTASAGGALNPILKGLKSLVDMTGLQSESGQKLKKTITGYTQALADGVQRNLPLMKSMVETALDIASAVIRVTGAVVSFATSSTGLFLIKSILVAIALAIATAAVVFAPLLAGVAGAVAGFAALGAVIVGVYEAVKFLKGLDWGAIGKAIVDGFRAGFVQEWNLIKADVADAGQLIKGTFKRILGISSPSKVFQGYGIATGAGYAQGVASTAPAARDATLDLIATPAPGGPTGAAAAPASVSSTTTLAPHVSVTFHVGGSHPEKTVEAIQSSSVLDAITHAVQTALRGASIPTGLPTMAGG